MVSFRALAPARIAGLLVALSLLAAPLHGAYAADQDTDTEPLRLGVLKFGTVNWTLDTIERHGLAEQQGVALEVVPLAGKNAVSVALQAGEVDMIVTDWVWVARQRGEGVPYSFYPYSAALGAVMVPADSPIEDLTDLEGRSIGVAGGPIDKSWLLLRALLRREAGFDPAEASEPVFAAPPLLNEQILAGRIESVVNFWHYAARLEAEGLRRLAGVSEILERLGLEGGLPMIGYTFDAEWGAKNRDLVEGFFAAHEQAVDLLAESDEAWEELRPLMKAENEATFEALRAGYREGIVESWGEAERKAAADLFALLAELGGAELTGKSATLDPETFWDAD